MAAHQLMADCRDSLVFDELNPAKYNNNFIVTMDYRVQ